MKNTSIAAIAAGLASVVLSGAAARAAAFAYNPGDLLIGFRNGGASDFVVDLGPITSWYVNYTTVLPNTTYNVTAYNGSQLTAVFGSLNNVSFSAFGDVRTTANPTFPIQTIWTTAPRMDISVQSDPWSRRSQFQQANTGAKIDGIAGGAMTFSGLPENDPGTNVTTASALQLPSTWNANGTSYTRGVGAAGNFSGTFPGSVENSSDGSSPIVSDLYALLPGSGSGDYLGSFTLNTDGSMTFTTVPEPGSAAMIVGGLGLLIFTKALRRKS